MNTSTKLRASQKGLATIAFILGILVVSAVIVGGSLYVKNSQLSPAKEPSPPIKPISSIVPIVQMSSPSPQGANSQPSDNSPAEPPVQVSDSKLAEPQNTFGFKTFQALLQTDANKNIFISPSSIALALLMTYNGAGGETKTAMENVLAVKGMSKDEINKASLDLITALKNPDPKIEINIANSIWARQGEQFNQDFLNTNQKYFQAKVTALNFNDPKAADTINGWVSENTKGKIPTIVSPPIPSDLMMYLINAIYFKGAWDMAFDKNLTQDRDFTNSDGSKKKVKMMQQHQDSFSYLENNDFQAVSLPYGKSNAFSMYVFLPKDFKTFPKNLTVQNWDGWMGKFSFMEGTVILPKFKIEYTKELKDALTALGMGVAFNDNANFEGIFPSAVISKVVHKTYIDVNEEGTEAAAATVVVMVPKAAFPAPQKKTFFMEVNKPFFYAIRDNRTKAILFMGTIQEL